jgi:formylglycine-generating enzyme
MGGNVWNWVGDLYRPDVHVQLANEPACHNPTGPQASWNPGHPNETDEHVTKGGSFLCNPSYCESYRPSARRGTPSDTGMSHIGFRCAKSLEPAKESESQVELKLNKPDTL